MPKFYVLQKNGERRATESGRIKAEYEKAGFSLMRTVDAPTEEDALAGENSKPVATERSAMPHGYTNKPDELAESKKTMVGIILLIVGFIAACVATGALLDIADSSSYTSSYRLAKYYQTLTLSGAVSTLATVVGAILIIIGSIQNKVIESHNLLLKKVSQ